MKLLDPALMDHLRQPITTLAACCRIQLQSGAMLGFTGFDEVLRFAGEDYTPAPGIQPFAVATSSGMAVDNTDLAGALDDDRIRPEDIQDGLWDAARVEYFLLNWDAVDMGKLVLRTGTVGDFTLRRNTHVTELRSKMQLLARETGDLFAPDCQADLGDSRCKVDLNAFTVTGTVTSIATGNTRLFSDSSQNRDPDNWFRHGVLTWVTGANAGRRAEIEGYVQASGTFVLFLGMSRAIAPGDQYSVYPGCDKRAQTCIDKYSNRVNFQGYDLPGIGSEMNYPDATF